jgi:hypothetical protein
MQGATALIQELKQFVNNVVSITSNESSKATVTGMRASALLAGAIVVGWCSSPAATTDSSDPRSYDFIKSEVENDRIELTCADLVLLLKLLSIERKDEARDKVLSNTCSMIKNTEF